MADTLTLNVESFKEAVSSVLSFLGIAKLYPHQENALFQFLSRKDVVVNLPTSYGKSLIYQIAPLVASKLRDFSEHCIIVVISPLVALMRDQVASLQKHAIAAGYVFAEQEQTILTDVERGKYNIVFATPESMLSVNRWRRMLTCEVYKKHLIGVAVDEAHCISHWYDVLAF